MSKKQKAAVLMAAALARQAIAGKVTRQQGAVLGVSVVAFSLVGLTAGAIGS